MNVVDEDKGRGEEFVTEKKMKPSVIWEEMKTEKKEAKKRRFGGSIKVDHDEKVKSEEELTYLYKLTQSYYSIR